MVLSMTSGMKEELSSCKRNNGLSAEGTMYDLRRDPEDELDD